jgi:integrase
VFALTLCVGTLIASEFMPVSLLTPIATGLHISEGEAGQAITVSGLFAVLTSLTISPATRAIDRRIVLLTLTLMMMASGLIVAFAPNAAVFMAGRALIGVVIGGFWSMSAATVMRLVPEHQVARALGILNGGNALATMIAAPLGSFLGQFIGWRGAFLCVVPVAVMAFAWQHVTLPSMPSQSGSGAGSVFRVLRRRQIPIGMCAVAAFFMGQFAHHTHFNVLKGEKSTGNSMISASENPLELPPPDGYLLPRPRQPERHSLLDGNLIRRGLTPETDEYTLWDTALPGFGLRVRPSGRGFWFVRVRQRGKQRRFTLGETTDLDAATARRKAREILAAVALDGLPKPLATPEAPTMADFVTANWPDLARLWKPSTQVRNLGVWTKFLAPRFGELRVGDLRRADVVRWRDDCAGRSEATFNRSLPVLGGLLKYAEALRLRPKGSNPCRGLPRYKRHLPERYLSPQEYRRLDAALRAAEARHADYVAVVRLLLYTGARLGEIRGLQWAWVRPPHLCLPDSKTGPKTIWLNRQAIAILNAIPRKPLCPYVFPNEAGTAPIRLSSWWECFRRGCAVPDLRLHDLRHSFASTAIMDNVPLAAIGKLLGHALPETTARYAHLSDATIADAAQRVSGFLAQALGLRP